MNNIKDCQPIIDSKTQQRIPYNYVFILKIKPNKTFLKEK